MLETALLVTRTAESGGSRMAMGPPTAAGGAAAMPAAPVGLRLAVVGRVQWGRQGRAPVRARPRAPGRRRVALFVDVTAVKFELYFTSTSCGALWCVRTVAPGWSDAMLPLPIYTPI